MFRRLASERFAQVLPNKQQEDQLGGARPAPLLVKSTDERRDCLD